MSSRSVPTSSDAFRHGNAERGFSSMWSSPFTRRSQTENTGDDQTAGRTILETAVENISPTPPLHASQPGSPRGMSVVRNDPNEEPEHQSGGSAQRPPDASPIRGRLEQVFNGQDRAPMTMFNQLNMRLQQVTDTMPSLEQVRVINDQLQAHEVEIQRIAHVQQDIIQMIERGRAMPQPAEQPPAPVQSNQEHQAAQTRPPIPAQTQHYSVATPAGGSPGGSPFAPEFGEASRFDSFAPACTRRAETPYQQADGFQCGRCGGCGGPPASFSNAPSAPATT